MVLGLVLEKDILGEDVRMKLRESLECIGLGVMSQATVRCQNEPQRDIDDQQREQAQWANAGRNVLGELARARFQYRVHWTGLRLGESHARRINREIMSA